MILSSEIEKLCSIGCNVTINSDSYISDIIVKFAALSQKSGGVLTIKNSEKLLSATREKIGTAGKNNVTFDFT